MKQAATKKGAKKAAPALKKNTETADGPNPVLNFDTDLNGLFVSGLKDMYWAENHLVKAIPKMISAAASAELRQALTDHLEVTRVHAARLEEIFAMTGDDAVAKKCDAMEGLTLSGEHTIENTLEGTETRDTGIIMSGLKVENFEITAYTGLIKLANKLGQEDAAALLQQNLEEETAAAEQMEALSA